MQVGLRWICVAIGRSDRFSHVNPLVGAHPNFELFPTLTFACHFVEEDNGIGETEIYAAE